ncbi:MAG: hypothetical protein DME44_08890 [Verrucomicrobia bacterium]|nr:MAG: hypothetical protein DME44_08890 [Verrucomicrobiota bacterium]
MHGTHGELAISHLVKLSRRHNHAAKLKRQSKSEKQFFTFDCAIPLVIPSASRRIPMRYFKGLMAESFDLRSASAAQRLAQI